MPININAVWLSIKEVANMPSRKQVFIGAVCIMLYQSWQSEGQKSELRKEYQKSYNLLLGIHKGDSIKINQLSSENHTLLTDQIKELKADKINIDMANKNINKVKEILHNDKR